MYRITRGDKIATTTLLEGRVKVYGQESGEEYDITPGCTLVYTKDNGFDLFAGFGRGTIYCLVGWKMRFEE